MICPMVKKLQEPVSTSSLIAILGWVEIELGGLGLGCVQARLWVTNSAV